MDHVERFQASMAGLRMSLPYSAQQLADIMIECASRSGLRDAYVQVTCTRGLPPAGTRDPRLCRNRALRLRPAVRVDRRRGAAARGPAHGAVGHPAHPAGIARPAHQELPLARPHHGHLRGLRPRCHGGDPAGGRRHHHRGAGLQYLRRQGRRVGHAGARPVRGHHAPHRDRDRPRPAIALRRARRPRQGGGRGERDLHQQHRGRHHAGQPATKVGLSAMEARARSRDASRSCIGAATRTTPGARRCPTPIRPRRRGSRRAASSASPPPATPRPAPAGSRPRTRCR